MSWMKGPGAVLNSAPRPSLATRRPEVRFRSLALTYFPGGWKCGLASAVGSLKATNGPEGLTAYLHQIKPEGAVTDVTQARALRTT